MNKNNTTFLSYICAVLLFWSLAVPRVTFASLVFGEIPADTLFQSGDLANFVKPNEWHPEDALPAFKRAPVGVYISVGADRGFLGAANTPRATHLLLIDVNSEVVLFSQMNVALLQIARDRRHYLELRLNPTIEQWTQAAEAAHLEVQTRDLLLAKLGTWKQQISHKDRMGFKQLYTVGDEFKGVNYLFDDRLFARIQSMAKEGRILVGAGDFNSAETQSKVMTLMRDLNLKLSVLDYSNGWIRSYTSREAFINLLATLDGVATEYSILLVSYRNEVRLKRLLKPRKRNELDWAYRAFTFGYMSKFGSWDSFYEWFRSRTDRFLIFSFWIYGPTLEPNHEVSDCADRLQ